MKTLFVTIAAFLYGVCLTAFNGFTNIEYFMFANLLGFAWLPSFVVLTIYQEFID